MLGAAFLLLVLLFILHILASLMEQIEVESEASALSSRLASAEAAPGSVVRMETPSGQTASVRWGREHVQVHIINPSGASAVRLLPREAP